MYMKFYKKGFTLVEILIVVALVAILASFAVPNLNNWIRDTKVNEATNQFTQLLTYSRGISISTGIRQKIQYENSIDGIKITTSKEDIITGVTGALDCSGSWVDEEETILQGDEKVKILSCVSEDSCNDEKAEICFFPYGGASKSEIHIVDSNNLTNAKKKIIIYKATGFIEVFNWKNNQWEEYK